MTMRQDPNFILDTLIYHRENPQSIKRQRFTWNRKQLLKGYLDSEYNINFEGQRVLKRFTDFKNFLIDIGGIHGRSNGGRAFTINYVEHMQKPRYGGKKYKETKLLMKIAEGDAFYIPHVKFSDVMNYSVLSAVNKFETKYFSPGLWHSRLESYKINVKGIFRSANFDVEIYVSNVKMKGEFHWGYDEKELRFDVPIPEHIPKEQHLRFKVRSLCNKDILTDALFRMIKQNYMSCCNRRIYPEDRFCKMCGNEYELTDFEILDVVNIKNDTILL
jgi:hypothetical protein